MSKQSKFFIMVLYNCKLVNSASYVSVLESLKNATERAYLYIYDNSPQIQSIEQNDPAWLNITYVHDPLNPGLGVAYNSGVKLAARLAFQWVILLDQDTIFPIDFIKKINLATGRYNNIKLFAPILKLKTGESFSPMKYKFKRGFPVNMGEGVLSLKKYSPVNSGLIIDIDAFNKAGGYAENVRLDFADFQFIERFRKKYQQFYLIDSTGTQDFFNSEKDINKNIFRFKIFLQSAKNCARSSFIDDLQYFYVVSRHALALSLNCKSLIFVKLFYKEYLKGA